MPEDLELGEGTDTKGIVSESDEGEGPMSEQDFDAHIKAMIEDAIQYQDTELSPLRAAATDRYLGRPFGNEEPGRSQVVLTKVRDAVVGALPSLLRVFFGAERVVEFVPADEQRVEQARQETDYVQHVFAEENAGFMQAHSVLKDGLIRKIGAFKWYWDDSANTKSYKLDNVTQSELEMMMQDDRLEVTRIEDAPPYVPDAEAEDDTGAPAAQPQGQPQGQPQQPPEKCYNIEVTKKKEGRACVVTLPPEEFIWSREGRTIDDALFVGHRTDKTRGELIAMGVDAKAIDEHAGIDDTLQMNFEEIARRQVLSSAMQKDPDSGKANDKILYVEGYAKIDFDGDGVAELRRVCTIGPAFYPVVNEPTDERPFSIFCPDPEPHTMLGLSWDDRLGDLQKISSFMLRAVLDSAAAAIFPRTAYVEGQANVQDILNTEIGAPIRIKQPNAVQTFAHPFLGKDMLPLLDVVDEIEERRTGQSKGAMGLDADALQSTEKDAAKEAVTASQAQLELLCRIFAEQTLKPLFKGIRRLLIKHQPRPKVVRLRDQWVQIDPRVWEADADCICTVALGTSFIGNKVATLTAIAQKQEQILQLLGPQNPVVTLGQYVGTLRRIIELQGFHDSSSFFNPLPLNFSMPAPQPQVPPEQQIAQAQIQIEQMKTQRELAIKESELQLKQAEMAQKYDLELKKLALENVLRRYAIDAQFHASYTEQQTDADADTERRYLETITAAHEQARADQGQAHDQALARQQQAHEQDLAQQQLEAQQAQAQQAAPGSQQ